MFSLFPFFFFFLLPDVGDMCAQLKAKCDVQGNVLFLLLQTTEFCGGLELFVYFMLASLIFM